jgi:hypothetical protein
MVPLVLGIEDCLRLLPVFLSICENRARDRSVQGLVATTSRFMSVLDR